MESVLADVLDALKADAAAALDCPSNPSLVALICAALAPRLPAYQRFVNLDDAEQSRAVKGVVAHGLADAVTEIPGRLVGHSDGPLELEGRDAFLGLTHKVDGDEPLAKRQVGIVHDGAGRDAETVPAVVAVVLSAGFNVGNAQGTAAEAGNAVRPAEPFEEFPALGVGAVVVD